MSTVRQPLAQLGQEALAALSSSMQDSPDLQIPMHTRKFAPELVVRQSTAAPAAPAAPAGAVLRLPAATAK